MMGRSDAATLWSRRPIRRAPLPRLLWVIASVYGVDISHQKGLKYWTVAVDSDPNERCQQPCPKGLPDAGLIVGDKRGRWIWYRPEPERLSQLRSILAELRRPG
jgi:hypothetical protein